MKNFKLYPINSFISGNLSLKTLLVCSVALFTQINCFGQSELVVNDTRNVVSSPNDLKNRVRFDFKNRAVIESPGLGMFTGVMTLAPWGDATGGNNYQLNFNAGGVYYRTGAFGNTAWESWKRLVMEEPNGNVGIGTTDPSAKLHINASLTESAIKIGTPNTPGNLNVPMGASTGGYNIDFYTWRDVQPDQIGARIRAERWNTHSNNNALIQSMDLAFYTSVGLDQTNLTEKMRISSSGNVSIGTKDSKGYKFAVAGNMIAESVKVQLQSAWPDYVFKDDYKLTSLQETEKHIKEKGHLPGIPSAAEVKSEGIDLGEMNKKLLQKIEELTLYLIQMEKKNSEERSAQESKIIGLKAQASEQQKDIDRMKLKIKSHAKAIY
ncbi:hypothetical protein DBR11_26365 [Pedobacter sp. HMWF019]|uniref:hypothetical protein n=1 Tax=Pedobacter sp. HMWF019 TaxID=2056856 RepID=UPI000D3BA66F|nr:hypothetical protein [Pedobacter sp. HMWF019]PTS92783.1 hypothetical protein DBR11_26365 [Pedobacter sp. HMWF019]